MVSAGLSSESTNSTTQLRFTAFDAEMSEKRGGALPGQGPVKCTLCNMTVYQMDRQINLDGNVFHLTWYQFPKSRGLFSLADASPSLSAFF